MKKLFLIIGLIAMIYSCQPTGEKEMTPEQRQEVANTIKQQYEEMIIKEWSNMTPENYERIMSVYVESNDEAWMNKPIILLNNLNFFPTKEAIYENFKPVEVDGNLSGTHIKLEEDYVAVLSPESALYVIKGTFYTTDKDGNKGKDYPYSGSCVYVLRNGEWKLLHLHSSYTN